MSGCVFDPLGKSVDELNDFKQNMFRMSLNNVTNPSDFIDTDPIKVEVFTQEGLPITASESYFIPSSEWREKIATTLRIDTTLENFESTGGVETFKVSLSKAINVDLSSIYITSVKEGSVIIDYTLTVETDGPPKLELSQKQAEAYAAEIVEVGGPILDIAMDLGDEPQQKIFEGGELTQAGADALLFFSDRNLNPKSIDDNCMKCQAQNEFSQSETELNVFCEKKDLSASKCCKAEMQEGLIVITDTDSVCQTGTCSNAGDVTLKHDLYKMCIKSIGRFMGQINLGYSDFQGQGNSGYMCGKNPQLFMGAEELTFNVKQPVQGVKDFEGL